MNSTTNTSKTNVRQGEGVDMHQHPIHLGLGATAQIEPVFTGDMAWYQRYSERTKNDGLEGRLVAVHTFTTSWQSWEIHPQGAEVVLCLAGAITLIQQQDDEQLTQINLQAGQYAINPAGVWHTADVDNFAQVLFITAGIGTQHRER